MFITDAIIPLVERRKNVINRWLAPKFGDDLVVEYDYTCFSEMNEDLDKITDAAAKSYWITPNEKRAMTNYDKSDEEGMDDFYFPSGFTRLQDLNGDIEMIDEQLLDETDAGANQ